MISQPGGVQEKAASGSASPVEYHCDRHGGDNVGGGRAMKLL
jgi:hypothetical protein